MNLLLMRLIDEQYLRHPEYGSPRMTDWLIGENYIVNHKRVARLMQTMGLQAIKLHVFRCYGLFICHVLRIGRNGVFC